MFEKKYPIIGTQFSEAASPVDFDKLKYMESVGSYGLTTAEILYRMPDHRDFLQTYVWQDYDRVPKFPELLNFLKFWEKNLDGPLHSVKVAHVALIKPHEFRNALEFGLH